MTAVAERHEAVIAEFDAFRRDPAFEELGGLRYLADLVDRAPPAANAAEYARVIHDLALRRELIRIGGDMAAAVVNDAEHSAREHIETAEQQLYSLAESGTATTGFVSFAGSVPRLAAMAAKVAGTLRVPSPASSRGA